MLPDLSLNPCIHGYNRIGGLRGIIALELLRDNLLLAIYINHYPVYSNSSDGLSGSVIGSLRGIWPNGGGSDCARVGVLVGASLRARARGRRSTPGPPTRRLAHIRAVVTPAALLSLYFAILLVTFLVAAGGAVASGDSSHNRVGFGVRRGRAVAIGRSGDSAGSRTTPQSGYTTVITTTRLVKCVIDEYSTQFSNW